MNVAHLLTVLITQGTRSRSQTNECRYTCRSYCLKRYKLTRSRTNECRYTCHSQCLHFKQASPSRVDKISKKKAQKAKRTRASYDWGGTCHFSPASNPHQGLLPCFPPCTAQQCSHFCLCNSTPGQGHTLTGKIKKCVKRTNPAAHDGMGGGASTARVSPHLVKNE